ncbi:MAG: hypothetical protein ABJJ09_02300 [Ascidiaceihabitans sp.]
MQQRQEARDALDDFPTPMWATRALCVWLEAQGHFLEDLTAREPCANRGYMVEPLKEFFAAVTASDVHDYGVGYAVEDYLFGPLPDVTGWTVMNPPFRLAQQFIERALETSGSGVAVFVRSAFLESEARYDELFSKNPPTAILQFSERVVIHKGVMRKKGEKYWDPEADNGEGKEKGKWRSASSATAYCWLIWETFGPLDERGTEFHWIPPCAKELEQPNDYEVRGHNEH